MFVHHFTIKSCNNDLVNFYRALNINGILNAHELVVICLLERIGHAPVQPTIFVNIN